jgi:hypothetical protein
MNDLLTQGSSAAAGNIGGSRAVTELNLFASGAFSTAKDQT